MPQTGVYAAWLFSPRPAGNVALPSAVFSDNDGQYSVPARRIAPAGQDPSDAVLSAAVAENRPVLFPRRFVSLFLLPQIPADRVSILPGLPNSPAPAARLLSPPYSFLP